MKKIKVLLEMRPAFEGYAGIPQEVRLLFRGLNTLDSVDVSGLLQVSNRFLASGIKKKHSRRSTSWKLNRFSNVIVSLAEAPFQSGFGRAAQYVHRRLSGYKLAALSAVGISTVKLSDFESKHFTDFTWRTLFSKSLPASDFDSVAYANHRICSIPWNTMHMAGLATLAWRSVAAYPRIDTNGVDVFIGQTPYPGTVRKGTKQLIRYHDAIPILMPHTIPEKSKHQATHFRALEANVNNGAWFSCVSETTRQDLLRIFPEVESRAVTIHNMVSHSYHPTMPDLDAARRIVRARLYEESGWLPKFLTAREKEGFYDRHINNGLERYLLMVSTLEPRKNHVRLIAAWEQIRAKYDPDLKLVIVGTLGWDNKAIEQAARKWIERGQIFLLQGVPSPDLRDLYASALATVCPSLGEGFDFSGVEAMRSGGVCLASDIPVHREIYEDGAAYFNPYSTGSLIDVVARTLYGENRIQTRSTLINRGLCISERYLPENILPKWEELLQRLSTMR